MLVSLGLLSGAVTIALQWWAEREPLLAAARGLTLAVTYTISATIVSFYVDRYFMMALPAVLFVMLYGFMQWPRLLRNGALAIVVGTALYMVLFSFHSGTYTRADWRGVADAVEERWQPGDVIVAERDNVRLAFERYFEPNEREATAHVTLLTGLDEQAIGEPRRVWVLHRNPIEDVPSGHNARLRPFKRGLSAIGDWLAERRVGARDQTFAATVLFLRRNRLFQAVQTPALTEAHPYKGMHGACQNLTLTLPFPLSRGEGPG